MRFHFKLQNLHYLQCSCSCILLDLQEIIDYICSILNITCSCSCDLGFFIGIIVKGCLVPVAIVVTTNAPYCFNNSRRTNATSAGGEEQGVEARQQQGQQRPLVVRRFHFAFQLDLSLIIKLAAVVFLFSQEGSRQRFMLLILFASFIYLYQTGALAPLIRWIRRGGAPQPRPVVHPEQPPMRHGNGNQPQPDGDAQGDNQNDQPPAVANENVLEAGRRNQNHFWLILKEIQMFVIGFITSLLPGFHHHHE